MCKPFLSLLRQDGDGEAKKNCKWVWELPVWSLVCLSLERVDTAIRRTNTCLSFHACQLVHPAQQGEYALYFETDLQQVEMVDIN